MLLSYLTFDFVCLTLSSAATHGIAKYARTYIRNTHTHEHTAQKVETLEEKEKKSRKNHKNRVGTRKERKKKGRKEKGGTEGEK